MRSLDAGSIMIPVAAYSGLQSADGASGAHPMLSFNQSHFHAALNRAQTSKTPFWGSGVQPGYFSFENCVPSKQWTPSLKEALLKDEPRSENSPLELKFDKNANKVEKAKSPKLPSSTAVKDTVQALSEHYTQLDLRKATEKFQFPCGPHEAPMNSAEKHAMTGSSNHRSETLGWITDVGSKNPQSSVDSDKIPRIPPAHNTSDSSSALLLPNTASLFVPPLVLARNCDAGNVRMFTPPFQADRVRHVQRTSGPLSGTGTSPYYSQAPRTAPYTNFFHPAYPSTTAYHVTTSPSTNTLPTHPSEATRSYLQIDNFTNLSSLGHTLQPASSPHLQLPAGYMPHSSATGATTHITPPLSPHARLFQQGRSILISRSPEGMTVRSSPQEREPCHVQIQLSPVSPQLQEDALRRKSYASIESVLGSSSCSPVQCDSVLGASRTLDFSTSKDFVRQHSSASPSHTGYRLPTGKEGSLKHRILRPPSISIVDLPPSAVSDAPLSAPPIRTHREPSPKQARSIPSSGYRSFSSSASSVSETPFVNNLSARGSPSLGSFPTHRSSLSSGSVSPIPPSSPSSTAQLKYPQSFMKGSIIQLANNQLKQVEHLTTEDFIECGLLSPTLKIDSSTVVTVDKMPSAGAAKLGFHVGQNNLQITVEAPLEHPFFVYKQGWSSCSPERSLQRYGLVCHKLKVGDVCISLTEKRNSSKTVEFSTKPPCLSVPISSPNLSTSNENTNSVPSNGNKGASSSQTFRLPLNYSQSEKSITNNNVPHKQSTSVPSPEKNSLAHSEQAPPAPGKRKRRWSAPDNIVQNEDVSIAS